MTLRYHPHGMTDVVIYKAPAAFDIEALRQRIAPLLSRQGAKAAFLIGSFARGEADAWSDIDLVVVMPSALPFVERPIGLSAVLDVLPLAVDLLVYTPEEFATGMQRDIGIFHIVAQEGVRIL